MKLLRPPPPCHWRAFVKTPALLQAAESALCRIGPIKMLTAATRCDVILRCCLHPLPVPRSADVSHWGFFFIPKTKQVVHFLDFVRCEARDRMHDDTMTPLSKKPKAAPRDASLVCEGGKPVGQWVNVRHLERSTMTHSLWEYKSGSTWLKPTVDSLGDISLFQLNESCLQSALLWRDDLPPQHKKNRLQTYSFWLTTFWLRLWKRLIPVWMPDWCALLKAALSLRFFLLPAEQADTDLSSPTLTAAWTVLIFWMPARALAVLEARRQE